MKRAFALLATLWCISNCTPLSAQVLTLLHSFVYATNDGAQPYAGLTASGTTLFGTTKFGGSTGNGSVFSLNTDGSGFVLLHSFTLNDGADVTAGLTLSGNLLYGASYQGGESGQGTLFFLTTGGLGFTTNYNFTAGLDGAAPKAGLLLSGNMLYGTAFAGGSNNMGTVFAVQTNGSGFQVLHSFSGADGNGPEGDLVMANGMLYGTTYQGGSSNYGAIFCIGTNGSAFSLLHSFAGPEGKEPQAGLVLSGGTLYGTASSGGIRDGTVFSMPTNGGSVSLLHTFTVGNDDGETPLAELFLTNGVLYGTTSEGGSYADGAVFSVNTNNSGYKIIYSFSGNDNDGGEPAAPVISLGDFLYGTTVGGGSTGNGAVFALQIFGVVFTFEPTPATGIAIGTPNVGFGAGGESLTFPTNIVSYQWLLNGVNIPGATNSSVQFSNIQVTNGGALEVLISDGTDATNSLTVPFTVSIATTAIRNDNFAQRFYLGQSTSGAVSSSNTNATRETGEPVILAGDSGGKSIWFRWLPTNSGAVTFSTQGSGFDTIMGIYTGTTVSGLTPLASAINDDDAGGYLTSQVKFNYQSGIEYEIAVDGFRGASGNVVLSWTNQTSATPLPTILQAPPEQTIVSNGATVTLVCRADSGVVSWLFNGQPTGVTGTNYTISSVSDATVGAYIAQVTTAGGVVSTEPAQVQTSVLQDGTTDPNSIAWIKFLDSSTTPFTNGSNVRVRPFDGGGDTAGFTLSQTFSTVGSVTEPGQPLIDGQIGGASVWYSYVSPTNGAMEIDTVGSTFNTMVGVFVGPGNSFTTLTNIGAGYTTNRTVTGQPSVYLPSVPKGQTNYIMIDGYKAATGTVHLNIKLGNPVVISTPPQSQYVLAGNNAVFNVVASGSVPLSYAWQLNGATISGAVSSSLTISNVQSAQTGAYTVIITNIVSAVTNSATLSLATLPSITTQPQSHTVAAGSTASLNVAATGVPLPTTFQWNFNGSAAGNNSSTLLVPNFAASNQGTYSVLVSSSVGSVASSNALVLLNNLALGSSGFNGAQFQLQLIGSAGGAYILQGSTNLKTWTPLFTNVATNGFISLTDSNAASLSHRFYRAVTN
jgi:uncharacterized repeat protein (TIGR03803 family)